MDNRDTEATWQYHNDTKHSYWSVRTTAHYLDWANRPLPFKIYPEIEPIALGSGLTQTGVPALAAIAARDVYAGSENSPDLARIKSLLYYSAGVTKKKVFPGGEIFFRAAACAGALYPIETYLVCGELNGLEAGVYHFNPGDFALRRLRAGDYRGFLAGASGSDPDVVAAPAVLVFSAITWRSSWKYRDRSYRYHYWDNGMMLANALAVSAAHRLPARVVMGFVDRGVNLLIGTDGQNELALSLLTLGRGDRAPAASPNVEVLELKTIPLSHLQVDYPSIRAMHAASSLSSENEVVAWRAWEDIHRAEPESAGPVFPLAEIDEGRLPGESIESVIQRRGSTRRFARKPITFATLSAILEFSTRGIPFDFSPGRSRINDIYVIATRVDGLEPGAYVFRGDTREIEQLRAGDFSERAAYLSLDQDLGGDGGATLFFMADLDPVLKSLGNRAYRAVQMEAGIIGGKAYLAAYALGIGATGLTFYDDDVTGFFSPHSKDKSCIFETAIGVPGKDLGSGV
jgi:SagB-type dehydrogenase family enzyme